MNKYRQKYFLLVKYHKSTVEVLLKSVEASQHIEVQEIVESQKVIDEVIISDIDN